MPFFAGQGFNSRKSNLYKFECHYQKECTEKKFECKQVQSNYFKKHLNVNMQSNYFKKHLKQLKLAKERSIFNFFKVRTPWRKNSDSTSPDHFFKKNFTGFDPPHSDSDQIFLTLTITPYKIF